PRGRRAPPPAARAAPLASSRLFPQPGPSPQSPSSVTSPSRVLACKVAAPSLVPGRVIGQKRIDQNLGPPASYGLAGPLYVPHKTEAHQGRTLQRPPRPRFHTTNLRSPIISIPTKSGVLGDHKITEVGVACRGFVRPKNEHRAALLGAVWTMLLPSLDVK